MPVSDVTNVNLLGLSLTVLMGILMILVARKYAPVPLLITVCFITLGQVVMIGPLHFTMFRILILFGWVRLVLRKEVYALKFNAIDKAIIWYIVVGVVTYTILWQSFEAFINRLGLAYNAIGIYFLFRFLVRDFEDITRIIKCLAVIIVPLALAALLESASGRNLFAVFGGVSEFTPIRDGKVRATISFGDAILTGTFAATLIPLFVGLMFEKQYRKLAFFGAAGATVITILANAIGPVLAYLVEIIGLMMWPFRKKLRAIRWGILAGIVVLHMTMQASVWALIGRLSDLAGGTGYHRVELIDAFIRHLWEWWLIGTKYTAHWGPFVLVNNPSMVDITNEYILVGVEGGLPTMVLFIATIAYSFQAIGRAIRASEDQSFSIRIRLWSIGVALLGHTVSFISVSYFTQLVVFWYMLLAMISCCDEIFNKDRDLVKKANFSPQPIYQNV